jgi:sugar transferase EpsL
MTKGIKRLFDFTVSLIVVIFFSPLFVLLSVLILIQMGQPIFFKQKRAGLNGRPFKIIKFRTMTNEKNEKGNLKSDSERLTKIGILLRKFSLDELPQIFNVLKGNMSLVGPRPLLVGYLPFYNEKHFRRHEALPGITGWAQVNGRQSLKWSKKFDLDVYYVENQSFLFDIKILFLTVLKVFKSEGVKDGQSEEEDDLGIWQKFLESKEKHEQGSNRL